LPEECARPRRFATRLSGLPFGLAPAVRPGGLAPRARAGPEDAFCAAVRNDLRVPLRVEGPARMMRGRPGGYDISGYWRTRRVADGLAMALAGAAAGYGGNCRRPVTGAAVRGPPPRRGTRVRRTRRKRPAPRRRDPRLNLSRIRRVPVRSFPLGCSRPSSLFTARSRQARRAEGAPLKPFVEKVVTARRGRARGLDTARAIRSRARALLCRSMLDHAGGSRLL